MNLRKLLISLCVSPLLLTAQTSFPSQKLYKPLNEIYHKGWIDFNKNGVKDIYEDPSQTIEHRVADLLSQMTVDEKTCQLATLYGYRRVVADELPTEQWKNEIWKDGIANIDEHLNGLKRTTYSYPYSLHARAINEVQRWFVEQTRLGIPVDFSNEGIHGLNHDRSTPLPAPIAIGSTWNKALVRQAGDIVGREAKALGYTNVYAPILDVARDQRWGRVLECYGEDPYLVAALGQQMV
ncbi:MAG: glycoside hydrolase family 3 N-terminal domain-containing protein, partial [Muribaculaceae bacterium]